MINAIANLGEYFLKENPEMDIFEMVLDDAFDGGKNKHLLIIVFNSKNSAGSEWEFKEIKYMELDSTFKKKILYKRGTSKGTDFTPTTKITELNKTFPIKIINWFAQNKDNEILSEEQNDFLNKIHNALVKQKSIVIEKLNEKLNDIEDKAGKALTVGFEKENNKIELIGNKELFKKFLQKRAVEDYKYSKTFNAFSYSEDKMCSICNSRKAEVFGFFTDLKFYNVDKAGMITGGFKHIDAWRNYPVCFDCALNIRNGYDFLKNNFNSKFYGLRYYFIPKITDKNLYTDLMNTLLGYKNAEFKKDNINRLTNDENALIEYIREESSNLSFTLFFYDSPQKSVLRILTIIEDVLPSRLNRLFLIKKYVDQIIFFKEAKSKKDEYLCYFNFGIVRNFFPNSKIEGNKDKSFLEITEKIFKDKPISQQFIIQNIMNKIKTKFARDEIIWLDTLKGFMFILYLQKLKTKEAQMDNHFFDEFKIQTKDELENKVNLFFDSFEDFFQTDAHRAIFLLGTLTQFLLNIQKNERNATPFRSKLKGLKMTDYDLSVLLPEIIEKLEQYGKNYYRQLEELLSKYILSAGNYKSWRLPIDEMNFIFVLGMNLSKYFKIETDKKEENEND